MFERRPLLGLLIGLTLCVSIWRISLQESSMIESEFNYGSQLPSQGYQLQHQQSESQDHHQQQISPSFLPFSSPSGGYVYMGGGGALVTKNDGLNSKKTKLQNKHGSPTLHLRNGQPFSYNYFNDHRNPKNNENSSMLSISFPSLSSQMPYTIQINRESLPKDDFSTLIDLHNFDFLMNQGSCWNKQISENVIKSTNTDSISYNDNINDNEINKNFNSNSNDNSTFLLILVHSAPGNYKKRLLIRETWGSYSSPHLRLIFLLGTVNTTKQQRRLEQENRMFSDMVQGNFVDAYRNMTYKHVMALKWFTYFCSTAKFILKIDDDVFVNTPYLLNYLNYTAPNRNLLFCDRQVGARIKRTYRSKWRVSPREYPGRYYPPYCPGYSIVYSPDVAFRLYQEAQKAKYFWIDDVHITGTLAQKANITITPFGGHVLKENDCKNILAGKTDINNFRFLFTWPDIQESQIRSLWKLIDTLR